MKSDFVCCQKLLLLLSLLHACHVMANSAPKIEINGARLTFDNSDAEIRTEIASDQDFGYMIVLYLIDSYRNFYEVELKKKGEQTQLEKSFLYLDHTELANLRIKLQSK